MWQGRHDRISHRRGSRRETVLTYAGPRVRQLRDVRTTLFRGGRNRRTRRCGVRRDRGQRVRHAPMAQGPGKIAKVSANVTIKQPQVTRNVDDSITFDIHIPLLIDLLVDLRIDKQRFTVDGDIGLSATARAAEPLLLIVDVAKPRPSDITVHVSSKSIRGELLRVVAGVDGEIRRFIAQYVDDEIDTPESQAAQVIDVAQQLDQTWKGI